jgi:type III restriction enzyme
METEQDREKHTAAQRWVAAVNNWGHIGPWSFSVCRDPRDLPQLLAGIT